MIKLEQSLVAESSARKNDTLFASSFIVVSGIKQFKDIATRLPEIKKYFSRPATNKLFFSPVLLL